MVARKVNNKGKKQPKRTQQARQRVPRPMALAPVEKAVRDYIALLKDPCNGPLVGPVGATANGYITRFEVTLQINPTHPNWVIKWTPGAMSFTSGNTDGLYTAETATPATALTATTYTNGSAPGYSFLSTTCQTYRCLAACAQVRYTDTEVDRRGVLGSTICTGARGFVNIGESFNVSVDRARVPDQSLEVLWQPGDGDELFSASQTAAYDLETVGRKNAILLSGTQCKAGSVSLRLVAVYQWTPGSNDSMVLPIPKPGTGITMARVVQMAQQAGFMAGHLIKGYATGGLYGVAREAASIIRPSFKLMAN